MAECDICGGTRRVRHFVRADFAVPGVGGRDQPVFRHGEIREYPCPECRKDEYVPLTRLWVAQEYSAYDDRYAGDPGFMDMVRSRLASSLIRQLLESGTVLFERGPPNQKLGPDVYPMRATLSVAPARFTKSLEARVRERQTLVAERAAGIAIAAIDNWNSAYRGHDIPKDVATRAITEAVRKAIDDFRRAADA